jgi:LPS-assembly protein
VPETSIKAISAGLVLILVATPPALADEPPCPDTEVIDAAPTPAATGTNPADAPITIESDDNNFEFDVNGNARICGNVVMKQGDRLLRADCLRYNATNQSAKLEGGVEYSDPVLVVRGNNGDYSPTLGATFQGTEFELPARRARGAATNMSVDGSGKVTLDQVNFTTCPADDV